MVIQKHGLTKRFKKVKTEKPKTRQTKKARAGATTSTSTNATDTSARASQIPTGDTEVFICVRTVFSFYGGV